MPSFVSDLFPFLYGICFLLLLWQAFRTMARGFRAMGGSGRDEVAGPSAPAADRTGRLTIHPELLDAEGRLTEEELLTVRFSSENDPATPDGEAS